MEKYPSLIHVDFRFSWTNFKKLKEATHLSPLSSKLHIDTRANHAWLLSFAKQRYLQCGVLKQKTSP